MSQWARAHPEEMAEIAALPRAAQNDALRHAVGYDPDAIRDQADEAERQPYMEKDGRKAAQARWESRRANPNFKRDPVWFGLRVPGTKPEDKS